MAIFLYFLQSFNFFFLALSSAGIYLLFLYFTKTISRDEIKSIFNKEKVQIEEIFPEEPIG
jgi:hypothetical protein